MVVDERVLHDGVQPRFEVRVVLVPVLIGQCAQRTLLEQVLGIIAILGQAQCEVIELLPQADEVLLEFDGGHVRLFNVFFQLLDKRKAEFSRPSKMLNKNC